MKRITKESIWLLSLMAIFACERDLDHSSDYGDKNSEYYDNPEDDEWDPLTAIDIVLMGDQVSIEGDRAVFQDGQVLIETPGEYHITGELSDGQIAVSAGDTGTVKLVLDNAIIHCSNNSPLFVNKSGRTVIILAEGSSNAISDGSSYASDESNATLYSKSDLVLTGQGSLEVTAVHNDGITSKDGLIVHSGNYRITAADDGIRGKDYLVIQDGTFHVTSGGDAITSDNENTDFGYIDIYRGSFTLESQGDGIYAYSELYLENGEFNINCSGTYSSGKALKAGSLIAIAGGNYCLESQDDAVHSDLNLIVESGTFAISTGDDGFHAENELSIEYADILITDSYEGLEAKTMVIGDGIITITSSDDGINTASGTGASMGGMQPGQAGNNNLTLKGGTLVVYANGDGLDINGSVEMSGGTLLIHGPTANNNGALDYDGSFEISGGIILAAGSSGMAMAPSSSSSQYSVLINFTSTYAAGTLFHLQDVSGIELATFRPLKNYSSIAISSPGLAEETSYEAYIGGSAEGEDTGGLFGEDSYSPGSLYKLFSLSGTTTLIGESGGGKPGH